MMIRAGSAIAAILLATLCFGQDPKPKVSENLKAVRKKIEEISKAKQPSCSVGTRSKCKLLNGTELPEKSLGYKIGDPKRRTHFGTDEMIFGLLELGVQMVDRYGDEAAFYIGDISAQEGGKLSPHINHQGGRDADIGFYVCDSNDRPQGNRMMKCDKEGKGEGTMRFDVARNWDFVCLMLESPYFQDMHYILVADWLKKLMIDHATAQLAKIRNSGELELQRALIKKAEQKLTQPSSSPHDNHFHLGLACTKEDRKGG